MPSMNRTIKTGFWKSPYIKKLQPLLKFVYLFLICGEPSSETSLYPFPLDFYAPHLGLTTEELKKSIQELEKRGYVIYDWETEEILVVYYFVNHAPNGGITYEMYRNDLSEINSQRLLVALLANSKKYEISMPFYAALEDYFPELATDECRTEFRIKKGKYKTTAEAREAAAKGRGKAAAAT